MNAGDISWTRAVLDRLDQWIDINGDSFGSEVPFPHAVIDGLFDDQVLDAVRGEFPATGDPMWQVSEDHGVQVKLRSDWTDEADIPPRIRDVVHFLNSGAFMKRISRLTGIDKLISDPYYTGGGLNRILPGGLLDVHCDGNWHHAMGVHRRINAILFLNRDWDEAWHGEFELWDIDMERAVKAVAPHDNRLLIFETHDYTYHGHPAPLACPPGRARESLILYYYTAAPRPADQILVSDPHRALWRSKSLRPLS
jgi:hypothetical protein